VNQSKALVAALVLLMSSGCATVLKDDTQPLKIETFNDQGEEVEGARCLIETPSGTRSTSSPRQILVERDSGDLHVTCQKKGYPKAEGRLVSAVSGAMFGNILLGGVIGAVVDHVDGQGYSYPEWVRLVFGKISVFKGDGRERGHPSEPVEVLPLVIESAAN